MTEVSDAIAATVTSAPSAGTRKQTNNQSVSQKGEAKPKPKPPRAHPPMSEMVTNAIEKLKGGRHGSSLQAIKKYIGANYQCDVAGKLAPFLRKALRSGVEKGTLVQLKGTGASGSFKLVKATAAADADRTSSRKAKTNRDTTAVVVAKNKKPQEVVVVVEPKKSVGKAATVKQKATKHSKASAKNLARTPKPKKAASPAVVSKKAAGGKKKTKP